MPADAAYKMTRECDSIEPTDQPRKRAAGTTRRAIGSAPPLELIARARSRDDTALEQLIRDYQRRVGRMVIALIGTDPDWPDLCQQIFVKMVHGLPRLKAVEVFEPWLFRIVRNACYDHLRHRRSRRFIVAWEPHHDSIAANPASLAGESASAALAKAIAQLPDDQRELITLMRDRQWSYESLARMTGDSLAAIKSRLFRARQRLRHLMTTTEADGGE